MYARVCTCMQRLLCYSTPPFTNAPRIPEFIASSKIAADVERPRSSSCAATVLNSYFWDSIQGLCDTGRFYCLLSFAINEKTKTRKTLIHFQLQVLPPFNLSSHILRRVPWILFESRRTQQIQIWGWNNKGNVKRF